MFAVAALLLKMILLDASFCLCATCFCFLLLSTAFAAAFGVADPTLATVDLPKCKEQLNNCESLPI